MVEPPTTGPSIQAASLLVTVCAGVGFTRAPGRRRSGAARRAGTPYPDPVGNLSGSLMTVVQLACMALQLWALIDCATRKTPAFVAANKLNKPAWLGITAVAALIVFFFGFLSFFGIAGLIGSIVYLVDVRPAVREIQSGGGPGRW